MHTLSHAHLFHIRWGILSRVKVFAEEVGFEVFLEGENGIAMAKGGWERVP